MAINEQHIRFGKVPWTENHTFMSLTSQDRGRGDFRAICIYRISSVNSFRSSTDTIDFDRALGCHLVSGNSINTVCNINITVIRRAG